MEEDLIILQVPLDLKEIMPKKNKSVEKDILRDIACGRFGKDEGEYSHYYEYLYENIQHCISEKKVIFIMFALESYCVIETRNTKTKRPCRTAARVRRKTQTTTLWRPWAVPLPAQDEGTTLRTVPLSRMCGTYYPAIIYYDIRMHSK